MAQCKYAMREHQISYDNGVTWDSLQVIKGELIEYESSDCPDSGSEITKWVDLEGDYICEDNRKYQKQILYVSYDGGATWYIYFPTVYRKGEYIGIDDELCNNKFEGHYDITHYDIPVVDPKKIVKCNGNSILTSGETEYYSTSYYYVALTSCKIGDCVTSIGIGAFYNCSGLTSVTIPNSVISIGGSAFYYCSSLTSVTIPNSVTSIGIGAFHNCSSLTSVTIPNSVTSIGNFAFRYCFSLTSATIGSGVTSIGEETFYNCSSLTSVTIPNSVTSIGDSAFLYCTNLTGVTIPDSVTSIGGSAFQDCYGLTSITIGSGVTSIGEETFYNCSSLTSVTIPNSVTSIGDRAFYYCSGLTSITINPQNPPTIGSGAFYNTNNCPIVVPCQSVSAYKSAWSAYANRIICSAEFQYRTLTTATTCVGYDLYTLEEYQVSYDSGTTWTTTASSATTLIEANSSVCGYGPQIDYSTQYLTLVPISAASTFQFSQTGLSYSLDSGSTWTSLAANTNTPSVSARQKIMFKGELSPRQYYGIGIFSSSDKFDVQGNAMSLLYGDNFSGQTSLSGKNYAFEYLFYQSSVVSAKNLVLPATELAQSCYLSMFQLCTSLTTAPQLPATALTESCYSRMFYNCSGLTTAPVLSATTLEYECYYFMFAGCTRLNEITCLATDISASYCTSQWVLNVARSGTFYKNPNMASWGSGDSGIPTNWRIVDYQE